MRHGATTAEWRNQPVHSAESRVGENNAAPKTGKRHRLDVRLSSGKRQKTLRRETNPL
jgi:hypothetical protein